MFVEDADEVAREKESIRGHELQKTCLLLS